MCMVWGASGLKENRNGLRRPVAQISPQGPVPPGTPAGSPHRRTLAAPENGLPPAPVGNEPSAGLTRRILPFRIEVLRALSLSPWQAVVSLSRQPASPTLT